MGTETEPTIPEGTQENNSISELEQKIIRQIEHYFGNYNLSKDKFLKEQTSLDDGWIPLETMVKFNRLKSLTEDFEVITAALKKAPNQLMEIAEDNLKIRRRKDKPLPEDFNPGTQEARTLYVKGFKKTTTLDQLLDFFREYKAEYICMRRVKGNSKVFKGSCFIMFQTVEDSESFMSLKGIKYEGVELLKEKKADYIVRKDAFYTNLRAEKEKKAAKASEKGEEEEKKIEKEIVPGRLLKITGLSSETTREHLWDVLKPIAEITYTDYSKGNPVAVVRYDDGVPAVVLEKATEEEGQKTMQFGDVKGILTVLEGEEEKEYWKNMINSKANARLRFSQYSKQNKGRFKKTWGKRSKDHKRYDTEPSAKKAKVDNDASPCDSTKKCNENTPAVSE